MSAPSVRFRAAADRAGYSRDEVIDLGRAYVEPKRPPMRMVEGALPRCVVLGLKRDGTDIVFVFGTAS